MVNFVNKISTAMWTPPPAAIKPIGSGGDNDTKITSNERQEPLR